MGKGDKRSKRGKINSGSYGNARPKNAKKYVKVEKPEEKSEEKTEE